MKTYLRMLRMVKPYTIQLVLAVVFMVLFSFLSIFSVTMISPFLEALFLKGDDGARQVTVAEPAESPLVIHDEAGVPHDSHTARSEELARRQSGDIHGCHRSGRIPQATEESGNRTPWRDDSQRGSTSRKKVKFAVTKYR